MPDCKYYYIIFIYDFQSKRKAIFLTTIILSCVFLSCLYFAQSPLKPEPGAVKLDIVSSGYDGSNSSSVPEVPVVPEVPESMVDDNELYISAKFWLFVMFALCGTVFFNIVSSISDAICFDVLGKFDLFLN